MKNERENLRASSQPSSPIRQAGLRRTARCASAALTALLSVLLLSGSGYARERRSQSSQTASPQSSSQTNSQQPSTPAPQPPSKPGNSQAKPGQPAAPSEKNMCGGRPRVLVQTPFGPMLRCPPDANETQGAAAPAKPGAPPSPAPQQNPTGQKPGATPSAPQQPPAQPAKPGESLAPQNPAGQKPGTEQPVPQQPPPGQQQPLPGYPQSPSQPGQTTSPAPVKPSVQPGGGISLNLENADLYQVLRIIGTELKLNYVVDPSVKGTVTISTAGSVSRDDLFTLLQTILQLNGAMMVKVGAYYRVMPIANAKLAPVPLEFIKQASAPPPNEGLTMQVVPMHFLSAVDMGKILTPFISPAGSIVVEQQGNLLLLTETPAKLKQFQELIDTFDSPEFARQRVRLFQLKNASAEDLVPELNSVFAAYALGGKTSALHFVPLSRLNMILAVAPSPEVFADVEKWMNKLDQPAPVSGLHNYVYMVQNAKASNLRNILTSLYGGQLPQTAPPPAPEAANPLVLPEAQQPVQASLSPTAAAPSAPQLNGNIRIMSDDQDNALIIQCTPNDYALLQQTIKQLDILPRQVLINAQIYQVSLTGNLSFGLSAYLNQRTQLPGPLNTNGSFVPGQSGGDLAASTFALIGKTRALQLFLNATENRGRVRMLSAPSILVTDNTTATIQVGAQVPVPLGSALTPIQSSGSSVFAQTIQYRDTGVILTVTPRINASGIVTLNVSQVVSSPGSNTTSAIVAPVINQTEFQTSVVLRDGEPLALGGLITTSNTLSRDRIPILGDIPGLGVLFGNTSRQTSRTELVLILTPHVIQDMTQAAKSTSDLLQGMKNLKEMMKNPD